MTVRDGLSLAVRDYRPRERNSRLPVLCLAGLTRNARDFDGIAGHLQGRGHRVVCVDSRGRGLSDRDPDWRRYHPIVEAEDAIAVADALGLDHYGVIGTSRGGILAMVMSATRPGQLARVVLNDIGPVIEAKGLARIKSYLGRAISPRDWADATRIVREAGAGGFPDRTEAEWREVAEATFVEADKAGWHRLSTPICSRRWRTSTFRAPCQTLWEPFAGLSRVPVLALRGELSDLLGA